MCNDERASSEQKILIQGFEEPKFSLDSTDKFTYN